jgi:hypothetical protein
MPFARVFKVWFLENSKEIARRCVAAPLKPAPNAPKFEPRYHHSFSSVMHCYDNDEYRYSVLKNMAPDLH